MQIAAAARTIPKIFRHVKFPVNEFFRPTAPPIPENPQELKGAVE